MGEYIRNAHAGLFLAARPFCAGWQATAGAFVAGGTPGCEPARFSEPTKITRSAY